MFPVMIDPDIFNTDSLGGKDHGQGGDRSYFVYNVYGKCIFRLDRASPSVRLDPAQQLAPAEARRSRTTALENLSIDPIAAASRPLPSTLLRLPLARRPAPRSSSNG